MNRYLFTLLVSLLLLSKISFASNCTPTLSIQDAFVTRDAIFTGKVLSIKPREVLTELEVLVEVKTWFKGGSSKTVKIRTSSIANQYLFVPGQNYLIYADKDPIPDLLWTNDCTRTKMRIRTSFNELATLDQLATDAGAPPFKPEKIE